MERRYYLDSSAYLCLLLGEDGHKELEEEVAGGQPLTSFLLVLEANRNLWRLSGEDTISPSQLQDCLTRIETDLEQVQVRELTLDLCFDRSKSVFSPPRSLEIAHLRTALWFHEREKLTRFVTKDAEQAVSARELGLPV